MLLTQLLKHANATTHFKLHIFESIFQLKENFFMVILLDGMWSKRANRRDGKYHKSILLPSISTRSNIYKINGWRRKTVLMINSIRQQIFSGKDKTNESLEIKNAFITAKNVRKFKSHVRSSKNFRAIRFVTSLISNRSLKRFSASRVYLQKRVESI